MESVPDDWAATRYSNALIRHWLRHAMDDIIAEALKRRTRQNQKDYHGTNGDCTRTPHPQLVM
jgi:hypothetical protein